MRAEYLLRTGKIYLPGVLESPEQAEGRLTDSRLVTALQSTWLVTSVKEEQSANLEPRVTKARMVLPSTNSNCRLLPEQNLQHQAGQMGSLGT